VSVLDAERPPHDRARNLPGLFRAHNGVVGQWLARWRTWDLRLAWVGAVDIAGTLLMIDYLLGGHHRAALRAVVVLAWVVVVPAITFGEVVRVRRRRRAAG
jgi:hypothetical protein